MHWVVGILPVVPIRKEPAHRSEMVSQLLFGECAEVIEQQKDFWLIRCKYDGYEGWCQHIQLKTVLDVSLFSESNMLVKTHTAIIQCNQHYMYLSAGTPLNLLNTAESGIGDYTYSKPAEYWNITEAVSNEAAVKERSLLFMHTPYLWGGRSVWGVDCSGFAQQVFRFFGKQLPRDAWQQAGLGETVGFLQQAVCGDLAFFDNEEGRITHVGIMLGNDQIIHASGRVRIDPMDNMGIVHAQTGERTHRLRIIKRI